MKFFDRMMMAFFAGGRKVRIADGIAGTIIAVLFSLGIAVAGAIGGYWQWVVIGMIPAILFTIITVILIIINIRRNTPRW